MFTQRLQEWVRRQARRLVTTIHLRGVTPDAITLAGLAVTAVSAVLVGLGWLLPGGLVLLFAGLFDILDGAVARASARVRPYGAFLDSTTDRYAEVVTFGALLYHYVSRPGGEWPAMLVLVALAGSLCVSYVRARAQSLGFTCDGGLLARPERVVIIALGLVVSPLLIWALWVLAVLTNVTALQRILEVWRQTRGRPAPTTSAPAPAATAPAPAAGSSPAASVAPRERGARAGHPAEGAQSG